jgi:thiamine biosynthesis lipoprotein
MKKFLSFFLILNIILLSVFLSGCSKTEKFTDYSFDCFDTITTIIGFEDSKEKFQQNCTQIKGWLLEYHQLYDIYSVYDGVTNLCILNKKQGEKVKVDQKIIDLLLMAKELYGKNKNLNVAMGSVLSLWHDYREYSLNNPDDALLPSEVTLKEASEHINFNDVVIDDKNNTVLIKDENLTLDVGAIGKGFAAQAVAQKMQENGMQGYLLNLGGNVKIVGERQDRQPWRVGIENPDKESADLYLAELELSGNWSLVTSGSYQRFFTVDGKNYHHIIDSKTLYPAEYFSSVSVLCENSALADGLSTLLFCLPLEKGKKIVEETDGIHAMWVTTDGEIHYSKDFEKFTK